MRPIALGAAVAVAATGGIAAASPDSSPQPAARAAGTGAEVQAATGRGQAPAAVRDQPTSRSGSRAALTRHGSSTAAAPTGGDDEADKPARQRSKRARAAERAATAEERPALRAALDEAATGAGAEEIVEAAEAAADGDEAADFVDTLDQALPDLEPLDGVDPAAGAVAGVAADLTDGLAGLAGIAEAARERARKLLAERIRAIEEAAEAAAADAGPLRLRESCGYRSSVQQTPDLDRAQRRNARTIITVAKEMDLPPRAAVVALATAYQESWLKNLSWGDRDSLGLFQQRPSMGWGSPSQLQTPEYAARAFYRALQDVGGWQRMPATVAAQRVQRSAFPDRYASWELMAARLVDAATVVPDAALNCRR